LITTIEQPGLMKHVFLTGASSGIGRAIAEVARRPRSRSVGHLPQSGTTSQTAAIPSGAPRPERSHSVEKAFNAALADAAHFDVLINNAGERHFGPAENLSEKKSQPSFKFLFFGQMQLMQLALRMMQARGEGFIITSTSLAGRLPVPFMAAYKRREGSYGVIHHVYPMELPDSQVRIVDLQPGDICTDFNDAVIKSELPTSDMKQSRQNLGQSGTQHEECA